MRLIKIRNSYINLDLVRIIKIIEFNEEFSIEIYFSDENYVEFELDEKELSNFKVKILDLFIY